MDRTWKQGFEGKKTLWVKRDEQNGHVKAAHKVRAGRMKALIVRTMMKNLKQIILE